MFEANVLGNIPRKYPKIWPYKVQDLHFRILTCPLMRALWKVDFKNWDDFQCGFWKKVVIYGKGVEVVETGEPRKIGYVTSQKADFTTRHSGFTN